MFERIDLVKSVKRTKKWWCALLPRERNLIVEVESNPKEHRSRDATCPICWVHLTEDYMICDRGICSSCAEKYNRFITRANNSLQPDPAVV